MSPKEIADPADYRVGQRIRALREAAGLTLEKLAFEAGLDKGHLSRLERGLQSPRLKTLRAIAERLGVDVAALVERTSIDEDDAPE